MKAISGCLQVFALFLLLPIILLLPVAWLGYDIDRLIADPPRLAAVTADAVFEPAVLGPLLRSALADATVEAGEVDWAAWLSRLNDAELEALATSLLPREQLQPLVQQGHAGLLAWLDGPEPGLRVELDVAAYKQHIIGRADGVVQQLLGALPPCSAEQLAQLADAATPDQAPFCRPPDLGDEEASALLADTLRSQLAAMPEQVVYRPQIDATPDEIMAVKGDIRLARAVMQWSWLIGVAALLGAAVLGARSLRGLLRWLGWPLLLAGGLTLLLALPVWLGPVWALRATTVNGLPAEATALGRALPALYGGIASAIGRPLLLQGGAMAGIGLLSLLASLVFRERTRDRDGATDRDREGVTQL